MSGSLKATEIFNYFELFNNLLPTASKYRFIKIDEPNVDTPFRIDYNCFSIKNIYLMD